MMQKISANKKLLEMILKSGVIIIDPDTTYIEGKVKIGVGSIIYPNSYIINANIGKNCKIGPAAHINDSRVGDDSRIGFTAQINRCKIGKRCMMLHHAYLGDTTVDCNVNIGAGAIVCNFDGKNKHQTKINKNAFIGSNTCLIAPITIGEGCKIAAGSVLPAGTRTGKRNLLISRSKEIKIIKLKEEL